MRAAFIRAAIAAVVFASLAIIPRFLLGVQEGRVVGIAALLLISLAFMYSNRTSRTAKRKILFAGLLIVVGTLVPVIAVGLMGRSLGSWGTVAVFSVPLATWISAGVFVIMAAKR